MAKVLITSALPYINGIKHLGNLIGSMLSADVYARFMRATGNEVLFICATDEHGTPAEIAALEAGMPVEEYCAKQHDIQAAIYRDFALSFDYFGRSSSPQNHELTNHFYHRLDDAGFIEERTLPQVYSVDDGRFLPDRYIIGTCPHCGYANARGDQCENCTRLLEPTDLKEARSAISGSKNLEVRQTKHLFLKLPLLADRVEEWIDSRKDWPLLVSSIAKAWLKEGLQDRGITRDLKWGVPVDRPGFEGKVFYVWFDAPIEYIGATREWADADRRRDARLEALVVRRRRRPLRRVHGQGQRAVPHGELSGDNPRLGRAVEAGRLHQGLFLAELLRRQVLDQPEARHLPRPGAEGIPVGLLALLACRQRARDRRRVVHL